MRGIVAVLLTVLGTAQGLAQTGDVGRGGSLVLQFDDGSSTWLGTIAPILRGVGGCATAFANNQYIRKERITWEGLRRLQDDFGWEIGTHTYHHYDAPAMVRGKGFDAWVDQELDPAIRELEENGIAVRSMVFPFNRYNAELAERVRARRLTYRRTDPMAMARGVRPDGSLPGTSIDLTRYVPVAVIKRWVDHAAETGQFLLLYGHEVFPDGAFFTGRVESVRANGLVADREIVMPGGHDLVLVPDTSRRQGMDSLRGLKAEGRVLEVSGAVDLQRVTAPSREFLIGPAYGTRESEFRQLVEYARTRLEFRRVREVPEAGGP